MAGPTLDETSCMTAPVFVDTNVLVYAIDAANPEKQAAADAWMRHLWRQRLGRTSMQVLHEFYVTVTRKLRPGLDRTAAASEARLLLAWEPVMLDGKVLEDAWTLEERCGLSFWDALVVSAATAAGCRQLLTEDLQDGQDLDGVRVVNPFLHPPGQ